MKEKRRTVFTFESQKVGEFTVETDSSKPESNIITKATTSESVHSFPTATIQIKVTEQHPQLLNLERWDQVRISVAKEAEPLKKMFAGDIIEYELSSGKNRPSEVKLEAISPFFRLQLMYLNSNSLKGVQGLRQALAKLLQLTENWGQLSVDDDVSDELDLGIVENMPAFSYFKVILWQKDLVPHFHFGDLLQISNRSTMARQRFAQTPIVLNDEDVINMRLTK